MSLSEYEKQVEIADRFISEKNLWGPGTMTQLARDLKVFDSGFPIPESLDAMMRFSKGISSLSKRGYHVMRKRTSKKRTVIIGRDAVMVHVVARLQNAL